MGKMLAGCLMLDTGYSMQVALNGCGCAARHGCVNCPTWRRLVAICPDSFDRLRINNREFCTEA